MNSLKKLRVGDVVLAKIQWRIESSFHSSSFDKIQRGIVIELNEGSAGLKVEIPDVYEWTTKYVSKEDVLDKVKHGRTSSCCKVCAVGFDNNCGWHSKKERQKAREQIEREDMLLEEER